MKDVVGGASVEVVGGDAVEGRAPEEQEDREGICLFNVIDPNKVQKL